MRILQPYDLNQVTIESLLNDFKILPIHGNKVWQSSLFPISKNVSTLDFLDKDHQITLIDDDLFKDYTVVDYVQQTVLINSDQGRKLIRCTEFGNFENSIKRYNQLDKPIDYNEDAQTFLNLPVIDPTLSRQLNVKIDVNYRPDDLQNFLPKNKIDMFDSIIEHPHIVQPTSKKIPFKNNDKKIIVEVLKWGLQQGLKYIYCINEYRPYIISQYYTTPFVYYTIKGSL